MGSILDIFSTLDEVASEETKYDRENNANRIKN